MTSGDPRKMAMVNVETKLPPIQRYEKMSQNLTALLPCLSVRTLFPFSNISTLFCLV